MLARAAKTENPFLVRCSETAAESLLRKLVQWCLGSFGWTSVAYDWFMIALDTIDQSQLTFCLLKRSWKSLHSKAWPTLQAKASKVVWRGWKSEIYFEDFKTSRTFLFSTFYISYMCVECGKDLMSYFVSSSSSSEVGNLYWRLTRPFSLLSLE